MKQRLGIFVFYNKDMIIEDYVIFLLSSMEEILSQLIVVVNGPLPEPAVNKLKKFAGQVYIRENAGYDGGAYKDVILNHISKQELMKYDELVLFNDTFYGPFGSWNSIFEKFEQIETDFWGLSKWLSGPSYMPDYPYLPEHIQSYFLVIRKRMLSDNCFYEFWEQLESPISYDTAIRNFEVGFTEFFKSNHFQCKTLLEVSGGEKYLESGQVVYELHAGDLIVDNSFPILKKKAISLPNFNQILKVLDFFKDNYPSYVKMLIYGIRQYERLSFPYQNIEKFYYEHANVYVFGNGKWGRGLEGYFNYKEWNIKAFVVTHIDLQKPNVLVLDDLEMKEKDGLIVALGVEKRKTVLPILKEKLKDKDILWPEEYNM